MHRAAFSSFITCCHSPTEELLSSRTFSSDVAYADIGISDIMPSGGLCRVDIGSTRKHEGLTDSRRIESA
jgi:hypothetical protein